MVRVRKEEGHYTIKIVDKLPKKGNANWLYVIKDEPIKRGYVWTLKNEYKTIPIGESEEAGGPTIVEAGNNVTVTGSGSSEDPYIINSSGGSGSLSGVYIGMVSNAWTGSNPLNEGGVREVLNTTGLPFDWVVNGTGILITNNLFGDGVDHTDDLAAMITTYTDSLDTTPNGVVPIYGSETEIVAKFSGPDYGGGIIMVVYKPLV